jgi:iron complex transport system substrate-binding protein
VIPRRSFLLALYLAACSRPQERSTGRVERIVSLSPSTTESVFALGAGERLVGRSRYCDFPKQVESIPAVGGLVDPSLEAILGLKPDLVIGVQGPGLQEFPERLEHRGIATYFPPTQSFDEIGQMLNGLGERFARIEAARTLVARLGETRKRISMRLGELARPRALLVFGLRPIVVAGPGGFPDEMLRLAGAENVVTSERTRFPTLGIERVIALQPDVVVDATGGKMREGSPISADLPGWDEVRAVKQGRIVVVNDDRVLRPGPRIGEGLEVLAKALHPKVAF